MARHSEPLQLTLAQAPGAGETAGNRNMQKAAIEELVAARPAEAERWEALAAGSPTPDVYYLPEYALAASEIEHAETVAVVAGADLCRLLAPLLIRSMSAEDNGSNVQWTDACSPYGYGGLLSLSGHQPSRDDLRLFFDGLRGWCSERRIVCCVVRLHPLMRQEEWFSSGEQALRLRVRGTTTAIDLNEWDRAHDRPRGMSKGRESDLNAARRVLRVSWTSGEDADADSRIQGFAALYDQSMEARAGEKFYRFPRSYFSRLAELGRHFGIASAWMGDELAGASIFLAGRDYAHYHLAAVNETGMKFKASTLLVVEGARWARGRGCKLLHLGGGLSPGDSLEDFKRSFGGQSYRYGYLALIVDPVRYEELCRMSNAPWPYRMHGNQELPL